MVGQTPPRTSVLSAPIHSDRHPRQVPPAKDTCPPSEKNEVKSNIGNNEKNEKNETFCIRRIVNKLERFHKCISQLDVVNKCVRCIWDAFIDSLHIPLKMLRKKHFLHFFRSKIKNRIYKKWPQFYFARFPAEQASHLADLGVQVNRKITNKKYSKPCQDSGSLKFCWMGAIIYKAKHWIDNNVRAVV